MLDCGTGARALGAALMAQAQGSLSVTILLSHTHWDHIQGFPFFAPLFVPGNRITVCGPEGSARSLRDVLSGQMEFTYFPVDINQLPASITFQELGEGAHEMGGARILAQYLHHPAMTLGYRIEADGASVVYLCDHEPFAETLSHERRPAPRCSQTQRSLGTTIGNTGSAKSHPNGGNGLVAGFPRSMSSSLAPQPATTQAMIDGRSSTPQQPLSVLKREAFASRSNASPRRSTQGEEEPQARRQREVRPTPHLVTHAFVNRLRASCGQASARRFPHPAKPSSARLRCQHELRLTVVKIKNKTRRVNAG